MIRSLSKQNLQRLFCRQVQSMMDSSLMKNPMDSVIKQLRKARNILATSKTDWRTAMARLYDRKEFLAMKVYGTKEFPSKKRSE